MSAQVARTRRQIDETRIDERHRPARVKNTDAGFREYGNRREPLRCNGALTWPSSEIEAETRHKERSGENPFIFTIGDGLNRRSVGSQGGREEGNEERGRRRRRRR